MDREIGGENKIKLSDKTKMMFVNYYTINKKHKSKRKKEKQNKKKEKTKSRLQKEKQEQIKKRKEQKSMMRNVKWRIYKSGLKMTQIYIQDYIQNKLSFLVSHPPFVFAKKNF